MRTQWFVDETKKDGLTLAVVEIPTAYVGSCRTQMKKLLLHGQSSLHFTSESDATRTKAYQTIAAMPLSVATINVPAKIKPIPARERAIKALGQLALLQLPQRIVIESDSNADKADRLWLRQELGTGSGIEYQHLDKHGDPLLWIADGFAWAIQRGGKWLPMVQHLIVERIPA